MNQIRTAIGNCIQKVLPVTPLIGPPLPQVFGIVWPGQVIVKTRVITGPLSDVYDPVRRKVLRIIKGY